MSVRSHLLSLVCLALPLVSAGCRAPGKPGPGPEIGRPDQLVVFEPLYQQNCAGCHGSQGKAGAAISLANPVYLAVAGVANIERATAEGVPGTAMPPFSKNAGGMLTDQQIHNIAQGIIDAWGKPDALAGAAVPSYASGSAGDPAQGQKTFTVFCARCHGLEATGTPPGSAMHHRVAGRTRVSCADKRSGPAQHDPCGSTGTSHARLALGRHWSRDDRSRDHRHSSVAGKPSRRHARPALSVESEISSRRASGDKYERTFDATRRDKSPHSVALRTLG